MFRGKRVDNGTWVFGYYLVIYGESYILPMKASVTVIAGYIHNKGRGGFGEISNYNGDGWLTAVDPETVGQYTGLKDKNRKEIFEGDIIDERAKNSVGFIVYIAPGFYIEWSRDCWDILIGGDFVEVIGNIHENKGLLKD